MNALDLLFKEKNSDLLRRTERSSIQQGLCLCYVLVSYVLKYVVFYGTLMLISPPPLLSSSPIRPASGISASTAPGSRAAGKRRWAAQGQHRVRLCMKTYPMHRYIPLAVRGMLLHDTMVGEESGVAAR